MRGILAGGSRASAVVVAAVAALWLALVVPLVAGERTLVLRDVVTTHLPYKAFGALALARGEIPAVIPGWALGQPFRGNPNALPLYPGNLLYLLLPLWSALNAHYVLHWLLAALGMARLARAYGLGFAPAALAALTYAGSGYLLSTLTFYNLIAVAAWAPWVLAGLARGGVRGVAQGGLACGLMLLGGEPLTAALVVPAMAVVALGRHGWRRGAVAALAVGGLGLALAAPQVFATARILGETWRATHGIEGHQVVANDLHPLRLLELVLPLPWGWPSSWGRFSFWAPRVTPEVPYLFTLHFGVVALGLALAAARRQLGWALLGVAGLGGAWALGLSPALTKAITLGLFRYPQKLLLLPALAGALLAAFGLARVEAEGGRARRWGTAAALLAALAVALLVVFPRFAETLRLHLAAKQSAVIATTQAAHWIVLLGVAALLVVGAAWAVARRSATALLALQTLALLQLAPAWVTAPTAALRAPSPWAERIAAAVGAAGAPDGVVAVPAAFPYWETRQRYGSEAQGPLGQAQVARLDLEPPFANLYGLSAPLAPDLEGLASARMVELERRLAAASWQERLPWLRRLGVGWVTRNVAGGIPGLEPVETVDRFGAPTTLLRVTGAAPGLRWPTRLALARDSAAAFEAIATGRVPDDAAVAGRPVDHRAGARLTLLSERPDEIRFEVEGEGGLAVLGRAYWRFYEARLESGERLPTQAVDLALLGVEVPPGRHEIRVSIPGSTERVLGLGSLLLALGMLWFAVRGPG